jgi:hypothetical protein
MPLIATSGATAPLSLGLDEILIWTILIVVAAVLAYLVYRAMERPRLRLVETSKGLRAMPRDVVLYAISIPLLVFLWWNFFGAILLFADTNLGIVELSSVPAGIVLAARFLAHVNQRIAHEIAKAVPLTIITLIIVTGSIRDEENLFQIIDEADSGFVIQWGAWAFILLADYVFTAVWYWGYIRWWQPKRASQREARSASASDQPDQHVDHPQTTSPEKC